MANIKQIIDDNIYQNGQQRITGIVMNSVLKAMVDDTDEKVGDLAQAVSEMDSSHRYILSLIASLFKDVVFTRDRSADVSRLQSLVGGRAICGQCICGQVICGN